MSRNKEWSTDWDELTTDPDDGDGPIEFWWDDMRRKEILELIQEVYDRAYERGRDEGFKDGYAEGFSEAEKQYD